MSTNSESSKNRSQDLIKYARSRFVTRLPAAFMYTASHGWAEQIGDRRYRVGLTKFATRMLGEIVEHDFEVKISDAIEVGQIIGWVEGFKAASDLYCIGNGRFHQVNPEASRNPGLIAKDPYGDGWLYEIEGQLDPAAMTVEGYISHLNLAIDAVQGKADLSEDDDC